MCQPLSLVPTRPSVVQSFVRLDVGVKQTDRVEVSVGGGDNAEIQRFNGQCHEECYAGLGGEMVCVHEDFGGYGEADVSGVHPSHAESLDDVVEYGVPTLSLHSPVSGEPDTFNTKASFFTNETHLRRSWSGPLPPPQAWVRTWGTKPPSPCSPTLFTKAKLTCDICTSLLNIYFQSEVDLNDKYIALENIPSPPSISVHGSLPVTPSSQTTRRNSI